MKRLTSLILTMTLAFTLSSMVYADEGYLIGREISPGFEWNGLTVGALFIGKFFDGHWNERGRFTLSLTHDGKDIEVCGGFTKLYGFRLIMNFNTGARLVLVGPTDGDVNAYWGYNDPDCPDGGCPIIDGDDYVHYFELFDDLESLDPTDPNPYECEAGGDAYIAQVPTFDVVRQRFGSYGVPFYRKGSVSGYLVHTPIVSPAIFGTINLSP